MMLQLCDKYKQALIGLLIVTIEEFCHRMKLSNLVPANNEFDDIVFSSTGQAIIEFFSYFDKEFKGVNRTAFVGEAHNGMDGSIWNWIWIDGGARH